MDKLIGATIGEKHTSDWGLGMTDYKIDIPQPKVIKIDVPYRNGSLDITDYFLGSNQVFEDRNIELTFLHIGDYQNFENTVSTISNYLHGKLMRIILDTDKSFYYFGRLEISREKVDKVTSQITLSGQIDPYKYERYSSSEPWQWDTFNFQNGIIRNYKDITVKGNLSLIIPGRKKAIVPVFICSSEIDVIYNGKAYTLPQGKSSVTDIIIDEGEHLLTFIGNGTVTVEYRGGSL